MYMSVKFLTKLKIILPENFNILKNITRYDTTLTGLHEALCIYEYDIIHIMIHLDVHYS